MPLTSVISPYDPDWPRRYEAEAARLAPIFGPALQAMHHIGSTAVPGLVAKPEIDILIIVDRAGTPGAWIEALALLGYRRGGDLSPGHRFFKRDVDGVRTHKVHLYAEGHADIRSKLAFRDHLRRDASDRALYGTLKLRLERENVGGIGEYLAGKEPFIEAVLARLDAASSTAENQA